MDLMADLIQFMRIFIRKKGFLVLLSKRKSEWSICCAKIQFKIYILNWFVELKNHQI